MTAAGVVALVVLTTELVALRVAVRAYRRTQAAAAVAAAHNAQAAAYARVTAATEAVAKLSPFVARDVFRALAFIDGWPLPDGPPGSPPAGHPDITIDMVITGGCRHAS